MKTIKSIFFFSLFLFINCNTENNYNSFINDIKKTYPQLQNRKWTTYVKTRGDDISFTQNYINVSDTGYTITITIFSNSMKKEFHYKNNYNFELIKKYSDSIFNYQLYIYNYDTLYFFKAPKRNPKKRIFLIGKEEDFF